MGNIHFGHPPHDDTTNASNDGVNNTTPNGKSFKQLDVDPRSPSGWGINRTPIQVEKTPENNKSCRSIAKLSFDSCNDENNDNSTNKEFTGEHADLPLKHICANQKKQSDAQLAPSRLNGRTIANVEYLSSPPRSPLKMVYGSSVGSPFSYLRHKQVQRMRSERETRK